MTKEELRKIIQTNIDPIMVDVNKALKGKDVKKYEATLTRLGRGGKLPHWYKQLSTTNTLPNLDGKTVGSVIEMIIVAVLENTVLKNLNLPPMKLNPARGVDLPDLDLSVKSPSENFCTSEPFFSAYERLIGNEYDILAVLTDYQTAKINPPLKIQLIKWRYLTKTQVADSTLCSIARKHRDWLSDQDEAWTQKLFRFLAFINQSDLRARHLLKIIDNLDNETLIINTVKSVRSDYEGKNNQLIAKGLIPIPMTEAEKIEKILEVKPLWLGALDAADNWVVESQKDLARFPNENEWNRLKTGPLDGKIGMSFALQWRFNFGRVFGAETEIEDVSTEDLLES